MAETQLTSLGVHMDAGRGFRSGFSKQGNGSHDLAPGSGDIGEAKRQATGWGSPASFRSAPVGDELHQAPVGIAEVDARPTSSGTVALGWANLDRYAMALQVLDSTLDPTTPLKAQIAVTRRHRNSGDGVRDHAGTVDVKLLAAEPVCPGAMALVDQLRAEHVAIKRVRDRPIRDMDHAVIELREQTSHRLNTIEGVWYRSPTVGAPGAV
jgi:hypothetical protein